MTRSELSHFILGIVLGAMFMMIGTVIIIEILT